MNIDKLKAAKLRLFAQADRAHISGDRKKQAELELQMNKLDEQIDELESK